MTRREEAALRKVGDTTLSKKPWETIGKADFITCDFHPI
jgi:hypothetical protein